MPQAVVLVLRSIETFAAAAHELGTVPSTQPLSTDTDTNTNADTEAEADGNAARKFSHTLVDT